MVTLSIIIPVYNVEKYLKKCLDSVLVDNAFTGQVICVNDGSKDGSLAILEQYAVKYSNIELISQPNAGLSAARNAGFDRATGDYVFFLDSDDWVLPGAIERIMEQIEGEDVVYFNAERFYDVYKKYGGKFDIIELKHVSGENFLKATINNDRKGMPYVTVGGKLYKRKFLIEHNLYNEPGIYHEDNYFTPQVLLAAKDVSSINEYVYAYRVRQGSISSSVKEKHIKDLLYIARNLYELYQKKGEVADVFYKDVCSLYINLILNGYSNGIAVHRWWHLSDSKYMLRGAHTLRNRKIAKLTFLSPRMAYNYMTDELPAIMRKMVNKYV